MSTYKNKDNCTDIILDMIAEHESAGEYNAVIGQIHSPYHLDQMFIADVYKLMDTLLYAKHMPSTAIGRYQIIRATLKTLVSRLELPSTTLFTPEVQDRLGVALLVGRGYKSWWRESISNEEFAHNISMEWASLPDPYVGGKSHYDGVGPNHAGTTLAHVYERLNAAMSAKPQ